eukprot:875423-Alexandrium_andersonii.AAC.1
MSASLVGSEMCIRDRFLVLSGAVGRIFGRSPNMPEGPETASGGVGQYRHCLLYTSDAADDM